MEYPDFLTAFQKTQGLRANQKTTKLECQSAGDLIISSGSILACDPYYCADAMPFKERVSPGHYPVLLCIAHFQNGDQRVALAALRISKNIPVRWKNATRPGENEATKQGYCVDSGTGCFLDADVVPWVRERTEEFEEFFDDQMTFLPTWGWVNISPAHANGANVVAFSSGWGDGGYPSFFGYDAAGQPACLITDFGVLEEDETGLHRLDTIS